ncbi:MAG: hypothetical protein HJJLKODD_02339 [Phycisphaerae bacterium]|nr:hypothetical protein [Phycisphaerae bacterium]
MCQQPVEVDDEWAGQQVGCPFCQRVVNAPTQSTLPGSSRPLPMARSAIPSPPTVPTAIYTPQRSVPPQRYRKVAILGLFFSAIALAMMMATSIWTTSLLAPVTDTTDPADIQQEFIKLTSVKPLIGLVLAGAMLLILLLWLAGLVLNIVALSSQDRSARRPAAVGLAIALFLPFMLILGSIV